MRVTILPYAVILTIELSIELHVLQFYVLTKVHRAAVSMMAKGCIVA